MAISDFSELNLQINKLDRSIQGLEQRVKTLQGVLSAGQWGSQQITEIQGKIDKLNESLGRRRAQRQSLIEERDVREIDAVVKAVSTLNNKLGDLYSRKTSLDPLSGEFRDVEKSIKNSENALKSFQSRLSGKLGLPNVPPGATGPTPSVGDDFLSAPGRMGIVPPPDLSAAQKRAQAERERLEALRKSVAAEQKYARAVEIAAQQNFSLEHLYQVRTRGTGGIEQLRFQKTGDLGEQRQLDLFVNKAGRATPGISNQFRTFGQGIARDIGELTKWSIALAAIYGPMRKLSELTQIMIENQTRLAEAAVSVSDSFIGQGEIFNAAAEAANKAGEEISGVIDAFTQAYRATGGGGTGVERFATANKLLSDALTLSKLSTLDQAQAIDTLAAALRQSSGDLEGGTELLDKWVRVTKVANVDLATLATGFAVLGDAAESAGIGVDELNGVIAAIAETGIASARESANVARALVSGFQSDQARKELENLGIAVEDTSGQMRPFLDVMKEIASLRNQRIIDDTQFSKLTLALGGGTRRQAAYATFIENFERVFEVANESARAGGDAQAALATQLETVQTAITRLGNAFEEWAQTLGVEGGFLSIVTESIDLLTGLVDILDRMTSALGKATPALLAFGAATIALKYQGVQGGLQGFLGGIGPGPGAPTGIEARLSQLNPAYQAQKPNLLSQNILGTNWISGAVQGAVVAAIPALMNGFNEQDRFGGTKAVADIIGGVGGGVIGSLVAGSPIIGAAIGTAIAETFVNSTIARKTDLFAYTTPTTLGEPGAQVGLTDDTDEALREAEIGLYESIGKGSEVFGRVLTAEADRIANRVEAINQAISQQDVKKFEGLATTFAASRELSRAGISQQLLQQAFREQRQIEFKPEAYAFQRATPEARQQYQEALAARTAKGDIEQITTPFSRLIEQNRNQFSDLIKSIREQSRNQLTSQRITGDVGGADYARRVQALGGFDTKALQYYTALGDELVNVSDYADDASDAFKIFNEVIVSGASDSVPEITSIVGEIQQLVNLLEDPILNEDALRAFGGATDARARLEELRQAGASLINDIYRQSLTQGLQIPDIQGEIAQPRQRKEEDLIYQEGLRLQQEFLDSLGLTADEMSAFVAAIEEYAVRVEEGGDTFYETFTGLATKFRDAAEAQLAEQGKISGKGGKSIGFQQYDFTAGQLQSAAQRSIQMAAQWQAKFGYKPQVEEQIAIPQNGDPFKLRADFKIMQILLQELVDQGQKMLDGQYNIPEGATFWVPLTAAYYRNKGGDQGLKGGTGAGFGGEGLDTNTDATNRNTQALLDLSNALTAAKVLEDKTYQKQLTPEESVRNKVLEDKSFKTGTSDRQMYNKILEDRFYTKPVPEKQTEQEGFISPLTSALDSIATDIRQTFMEIINSIKEGFSTPFGAPTGEQGAAQPPPVARLDLKIDSNTQLIVDGRTLANVIKPYLQQDLLRTQEQTGIVTRRFVI